MSTLGFMGGMPGHMEILLIIFIILLLFGAKKLPELSRSLGKSLSEFKKGQREGSEPEKQDDAGNGAISSPEETDASDDSENKE